MNILKNTTYNILQSEVLSYVKSWFVSIAQFFFVSTYFVTGITILGIQQTGPALTRDHFLPKVSRETVEKFCWKAATTNIDQNYKQFYNCTKRFL